MNDYSVVDRRKCSFMMLSKAIPLAYAPYVGAEAVSLYLLYASLADQGNAVIEQDDLKEFLNMDDESLEKCNQVLEEYGLVKLENQEHNGRIVSNCYVLQPPPLPQTLYQDLRTKTLTGYIEDVLDFAPAESPRKQRRSRQSLVTAAKLITKLYQGMGRGKADIFEREAAKNHIGDLLEAGYSLEDMDFAIEWSLENAPSEVEDFSSIKNLMERATAAREEYMTKRTQQVEEEVKDQEEEQIERKMVDAYRNIMSDGEKKKLRERVMAEILKDERINEEFVTEQYIVVEENKIIRREYLHKRGAED
ncbi:hypothetical protein ACFL6S_14870 [Candidatus Poribacteria bacterium]